MYTGVVGTSSKIKCNITFRLLTYIYIVLEFKESLTVSVWYDGNFSENNPCSCTSKKMWEQ